jgi:hypothetical protein
MWFLLVIIIFGFVTWLEVRIWHQPFSWKKSFGFNTNFVLKTTKDTINIIYFPW